MKLQASRVALISTTILLSTIPSAIFPLSSHNYNVPKVSDIDNVLIIHSFDSVTGTGLSSNAFTLSLRKCWNGASASQQLWVMPHTKARTSSKCHRQCWSSRTRPLSPQCISIVARQNWFYSSSCFSPFIPPSLSITAILKNKGIPQALPIFGQAGT